MDLVFRLERFRGIQPLRFLHGTDCSCNNSRTGKESRENKSPRFHTEIQSKSSKSNQRFKREDDGKQEFLVDSNRSNWEQEKEKPITKKSKKETQEEIRGVMNGI